MRSKERKSGSLQALVTAIGGLVIILLLLVGGLGSQAAAPQAAPLDIVINEIAWGGTAAGSADEWIELYNNTASPVSLIGWTLKSTDGLPSIDLVGVISAHGYHLLERGDDDCTVSDIPADQTFKNALHNDGEHLELRDASEGLVDSVNASGGWPAGSDTTGYHTMERINPAGPSEADNWRNNNGLVRNGRDCNNQPLNGTPRARNSASLADLNIVKRAPQAVLPGKTITYTIVLSNAGPQPALGVGLTDVLPIGVRFQTQQSSFAFSQPQSNTLVWDLGTVYSSTASAPVHLTVTGLVENWASGELINVITVTSMTTESYQANNHYKAVTIIGSLVEPVVVIEALYARTYGGLYDEAVRLMNVSTTTAQIEDWSFGDGVGTVTFPADTNLAPGQRIWCTRQAQAFHTAFGFLPDYEWAGTHPDVPDLDYSGSLRFNDSGDMAILWNGDGQKADALVYGDGLPPSSGWNGPAVQPYQPSNAFPAEGQILYRKRDQETGWPFPDTDTSADWAQDATDNINGRKVYYPGWDLEQFFWTTQVTNTAVLTIAVGPDHLLETLLAQIKSAQESIVVEAYTLESAVVAQALLERLADEVTVTLLLDGSPVGGASDSQRWICGQLRDEGGQIYFLSSAQAPVRYRSQHAKTMIIDDHLVLIGSENLNPGSLPVVLKGDSTAGRRGVYLITDAPGVVIRVRAIMAADIDPAHHRDLVTCAQVPDLCSGQPPLTEPNWTSYTIAFPEPLTIQGQWEFEVVQAPENALQYQDSLLGLLSHAGPGDEVLVEQSLESLTWGAGDTTPETDPNLRLESYLAAARRGARVRILLDSHFNKENNGMTVGYLRAVALREGLSLEARLGNPTGLGIHNKMVLAQVGERGYIHVGSINGSEISSKANRELALQVQSDEAFAYLKAVFDHDWRTAKAYFYLPQVSREYQPPRPAAYPLISEVYYPTDPEEQWVEIYNPTDAPVDLTGYKIGDAANLGDYEGMYLFPAGAVIGPEQVLIIAANAVRFREDFSGDGPDYELSTSAADVPTLLKDRSWSQGMWWLRQDGDEVLLLGASDSEPIDAIAYGDSPYPDTPPHPGVERGSSLERFPSWLDRDDCAVDFRAQPFPNPREVP